MENKNLIIYLIACILYLFTACQDSEDELQMFEIAETALQQDFLQSKQSINIPVNTNMDDTEWSLKSDVAWCTVAKNRQNGKPVIYMEVENNTGTYVRTATVSVHSSIKEYEIHVRQLGYGSAILVSQQTFLFDATGGDLEFIVTANVDVDITTPDWITKVPKTKANEMIPRSYKYLVKANNTDDSRQVNLEVKEILPTGVNDEPKIVLVSVGQKGLGTYEPGEIGNQLKDDVKLEIVSGNASSQNSISESIEKSFDGDISSIYHSKYSEADKFPFTLTYNLDKAGDVDYFVYYPRADGGVNGNFKEVEILYSVTGNEPFITLKKFDLGGSGSPAMISFDNTVHARSFRFRVESGTGGYASCAEIEFYARNTESFDYSTLFTDETCSELNPGISETQIEACLYPFFKNMAYYMFQNKYPREFRIAAFNAYPNPDIQAETNRTAAYSQLDNPTGISVKKDETLVVMMGNPHGYNISLRVQNLEPPSGQLDGYGYYKTYPLKRGINKLTMKDNGLVYVMYHTSTLEAAETQPPIKIHFATGLVNGYFDTQNPAHTGRWTELVNNASDRYFDLVGRDVHMTFETSAFRQYTGTHGVELANLMDSVVHSQQRLLGLYRYGNRFHNRLYMHVMYNTSVLYAASYHTGYHMNAQPQLLNPAAFPADCWGVAHEIGHVHQTRPGIRWLGMTEVTNNIMSEYIQTTTLRQTSRLQSENIYSSAQDEMFLGEKAFCECSDLFRQLVPFWQLELYFGKVLGKTPLQQADQGGFYPDVYEYARTKNYTGMSNGEIQLDFVYNCCLASGKNLLGFFERWGFLKPVDKNLSDYSDGRLLVTENMASELRNKVNGLGYPAPEAALEFITDNTVELFKQNPSIIQGAVQKSGSTVTLSGWKNVVAFEVKDVSGKLISIGSGTTSTFSLPVGTVLYAVAANGNRIQVIRYEL
ncbi:MAG: M60 family metallopeptidase [Prevotella sp.]|nr:M60 family metallopeptidase [Prevotella sp.]